MKFFNTAGPVNQPEHYKVDPLHRWDLEEILTLIAQKKYFILHAPRQTGKTSCMLALRDYLNEEGKYFALYVNVEIGQAVRNNVHEVNRGTIRAILDSIPKNLECLDKIKAYFDIAIKSDDFSAMLQNFLQYLAETIEKPIVLFIDEIDALIGDSLISVLRQIRSGYISRPDRFPSTIVLCGLRDIKDYRIHTSGQEIITGGSAFNIKAESMRLGNFTRDDVVNLYTQHTEETGQKFDAACFDLVMRYTDGQPWLVNALAFEVVHKMIENRDRSITITEKMIERAKERLILARQTHLDQLTDKLKEDRVRRIILPMILSEDTQFNHDDTIYCIDLGLIKKTKEGLQIANEIYSEIIPRELSDLGQTNFLHVFHPRWIASNGSICTKTLLSMFKDFWNENSEMVVCNIPGYAEAVPQLFLQAYLQRVVNGGGYINREYGLGRRRTDIHIKWIYRSQDTDNTEHTIQNIVIELKIIKKGIKYATLIKDAIAQTAAYAHTCGTTDAHILIFDRDKSQKWKATQANEIVHYEGIKIEIWKLGRGTW